MTTTARENASVASSRYQNAAEWLHDLGDVPLERIIFDPYPGTATEADLLKRVEVDKQMCELVYGTLVEKPAGYYESLLAMLIGMRLLDFVLPRKLGLVAGEGGTIRLSPGLVRIPDVSFISPGRLRGWKGPREPIPSVAPDLAIEVLSQSNTPGEMSRKLREYFDAGTNVVWFIDPLKRSAHVYTSAAQVRLVDATGTLDGGDVLPGFELRLAELFAQADAMYESTK